MEDYLKIEYGVREDPTYLKTEADIVEHFKDCWDDLLECGQGYSTPEETFKVMTQDGKFYEVTIKAEIGASWQDRGDKLYYVERIEEVTYKEIEKPSPKPRTLSVYNFSLTENETKRLEYFLKENKINFIKS